MRKKIGEIGCHVKLKKRKTKKKKTKKQNYFRHEIQRDDALCCIQLKIDITALKTWEKLQAGYSTKLKNKKIECNRNKLEKSRLKVEVG